MRPDCATTTAQRWALPIAPECHDRVERDRRQTAYLSADWWSKRMSNQTRRKSWSRMVLLGMGTRGNHSRTSRSRRKTCADHDHRHEHSLTLSLHSKSNADAQGCCRRLQETAKSHRAAYRKRSQ